MRSFLLPTFAALLAAGCSDATPEKTDADPANTTALETLGNDASAIERIGTDAERGGPAATPPPASGTPPPPAPPPAGNSSPREDPPVLGETSGGDTGGNVIQVNVSAARP